jgi:hypothetical protein
MKDTIKEADLLLAEIMGYVPDDFPKWTQRNLTLDQNKKLNSERYQLQRRNINRGRYNRTKYEIETRSRAAYDYLHPRRAKHWPAVIKTYLTLSDEERAQIDRDGLKRMIDYYHPDEVRERKDRERHAEQARKEARRVRTLPENKNQRWTKNEILWNEEGERVSNGVRKGSTYRRWYRWFTNFIDLLDRKQRPGYRQDEREISLLSPQTSWDTAKLAGGESDRPVYNSSEFSDGYGFGALPPPGKKKSGRTRQLLGEK